jgi:transcriptional regulator with XRE-family HTH domain
MIMNELNPMEKIKQLRQRLGFSQEELAEKSGLSLRTIQRIENGETEPRGDSLKRISAALGVTPNEIVDWAVQEDTSFLKALNLSALTFLVFPLLGIIVPAIIWGTRKKTVKDAEQTGKEIVNFQITWNILLFLFFLFIVFLMQQALSAMATATATVMTTILDTPDIPPFVEMQQALSEGYVSATVMTLPMAILAIGIVLLYLCNLIFILVNQVRIPRGKRVRYFPKINFIR